MEKAPDDLEEFNGRNRSYRKKISIRKNGQIALNVGAVRAYDLDDYAGVKLYYGRKSNMLGIKPTNDTGSDGFIKAQIHNDAIQLYARSFLDFYEIPYEETKRVPVVGYDETKEMILADLTPILEGG